MTGNPLTPYTKWEAVKYLALLIFIVPLVRIKEAIQKLFNNRRSK